ncbi:type IV pilus biogenesis protein PilM [Paraburkholderia sp. SARCC-3016]|uniref:type IV pilus biogenesis protein PilM n=1 Tax=Paraburkholderia sp. SARCC-3016 TaxID=3058611 RepID=UPI002809F185|nr:type IV pilus biogenesis protein PilM [Paraburkholderia sp. SARCC-3016]MDQ7980283.1 type IV pilus biogenesis protein PilM [Paraburkholderia sp. SARCC-3016]
MYVIWAVAVLGMLSGAYALMNRTSTPLAQGPSSIELALNMREYQQAVVAFALANPSFTGSVPASSLGSQLGSFNANAMWQNYVQPNADFTGSLVVVYAIAVPAAAVVTGMQQLAQGSALAGVAQGATIVSPGNPPVALPPALANVIPAGMPVWMAQAYE